MFSLPPWLQKISWLIYTVVVLIIVTVAEDIITTIFHPFSVRLVNATQNSTYFSGENVQSWANFDLVPLALTLIIVGLTASWWVNRAQNKTKKIESELKEAEASAKRDIKAVYSGYNEVFQGQKNRYEQEINSLRADGINAIQENSDFWQKQLKEEQKEANKLLEVEKAKYEKEISDLANLCKKLKTQLDIFNKEKQERRLKEPKTYIFPDAEAITKQIQYQVDMILDITTPEELLSIEAAEALKKYDK